MREKMAWFPGGQLPAQKSRNLPIAAPNKKPFDMLHNPVTPVKTGV
jgi:hypothetical protein